MSTRAIRLQSKLPMTILTMVIIWIGPRAKNGVIGGFMVLKNKYSKIYTVIKVLLIFGILHQEIIFSVAVYPDKKHVFSVRCFRGYVRSPMFFCTLTQFLSDTEK